MVAVLSSGGLNCGIMTLVSEDMTSTGEIVIKSPFRSLFIAHSSLFDGDFTGFL